MNIRERHWLARRLQNFIYNIQWPVNALEPDYVAKLVDVLPRFIANTLSGLLPGRQISAGGAFIHQKPLAHFIGKTGYKDPELGDLLVVCREKRFSGYVYNAMLLQAKRSKNPFNETVPNDHQYLLYSEWPEFEYRRAGILNGKTRSILPKTITQGAQYLLIDDIRPGYLYTATVDRPMNGSKWFARTLATILSFDGGRTFQVSNPRDDWSQVILDLLCLSASAVFNRRNSGYVGAHRWNGDAAFDYILNSDVYENDKNGYQQSVDVAADEALSGMSVICVDLGSSTGLINEGKRIKEG